MDDAWNVFRWISQYMFLYELDRWMMHGMILDGSVDIWMGRFILIR